MFSVRDLFIKDGLKRRFSSFCPGFDLLIRLPFCSVLMTSFQRVPDVFINTLFTNTTPTPTPPPPPPPGQGLPSEPTRAGLRSEPTKGTQASIQMCRYWACECSETCSRSARSQAQHRNICIDTWRLFKKAKKELQKRALHSSKRFAIND